MGTRVCIIGHSFSDSDTRKLRYADALTQSGASVDVVGLGHNGQPRFDHINGANFYRIHYRTRDETHRAAFARKLLIFWWKSALFLCRTHGRRRYDVIHVTSVPDFEVFAAWWPKIRGARIILDIYDISPEFYVSKFDLKVGCPGYHLLLAIERLAARFADHVIVANDLWHTKLTARSVPPWKCSVFVNYLDPKLFDRKERTRRDNRVVVVYPGNLNRHQGADIAVQAFGAFAKVVPEAEFHIYGDGPEKRALMRLADELSMGDKILFKPSVPHRDIPGILADADLGVVGKRADVFGDEAFSTKIIEYMSQGVPVVAPRTRIDAHYFPEKAVAFFGPGDPVSMAKTMISVWRDPVRRQSLIEEGFRCLGKFSWEDKKQEYISLVDRLTASGHKRSSITG